MASAVPTTNRRLFLASGTFAAVSGGLAIVAQAFPQSTGKLAARALPIVHDPVIAALDHYAQVRANYHLALDEYARVEHEHREICFYNPKVIVHTENLQLGGATTFEARSAEAIDLLARGASPTYIAALKDELTDDERRHAADLHRIGYTAADAALDGAHTEISEAESAVLNAVPTTEEGAIQLANFTATLIDEGVVDLDEVVVAVRSLGDWLIARRHSRVEA